MSPTLDNFTYADALADLTQSAILIELRVAQTGNAHWLNRFLDLIPSASCALYLVVNSKEEMIRQAGLVWLARRATGEELGELGLVR
jgi:hypothetical protein